MPPDTKPTIPSKHVSLPYLKPINRSKHTTRRNSIFPLFPAARSYAVPPKKETPARLFLGRVTKDYGLYLEGYLSSPTEGSLNDDSSIECNQDQDQDRMFFAEEPCHIRDEDDQPYDDWAVVSL